MAYILGKEWKRDELLSYLGDPLQLAGAEAFMYTEGKAQGVRGVQVNTGSGLEFCVLPGRGMDIPEAFFMGTPLHFFSGTGVTSPAYYEEPGFGWLRSFFVGLLTTCGITNAGAPGTDQGEAFGLHGRVANTGAENVCVDQYWDEDQFAITLKGKMREAKAMAENVSLTRTVQTRMGWKKFVLRDLVCNHGFEPQPLLMLYHFNFGFPLLSPGAQIVGPVEKTEPRDREAEKDRGVEQCMEFPRPVQGCQEKVFFHTLKARRDGSTFMGLVNRKTMGKAMGVVMRFNLNQLPCLTEWKMPRKGFYVLGLEPGTAPPVGRGVLREEGRLPFLDGQSSYPIDIEFEVLASQEEIESLLKEQDRILKQ